MVVTGVSVACSVMYGRSLPGVRMGLMRLVSCISRRKPVLYTTSYLHSLLLIKRLTCFFRSTRGRKKKETSGHGGRL